MRFARLGILSALLVLLLMLSALPVVFSFVTGQCSSLILGQGGSLKNGFNLPQSVAVDHTGNVWVADTVDNRVLGFAPPLVSHMDASVAIGQKDLTARSATTSKNGLNSPTSVVFDISGNMWVADNHNGRVLEFVSPLYTGENASVVIGAPDFNTASATLPSATRLTGPTGIAFDPAGNLWVVEESANRVVEFAPPFSNGMSASEVVGQNDFTSFFGGTSQRGLSGPVAIAFDSSGDLWVTDTQNNRVLEFSAGDLHGPDPPATTVLGQSSFLTKGSALSATGLFNPQGLAFSSGFFLWVVDSGNARVLEFKPTFSTGEGASFVLGAADFTHRGYPGLQVNQSAVFDGASGVAVDPSVGDLWVTEASGNVVVRFDHNGSSCASTVTTVPSSSTSSLAATSSSSSTSPSTNTPPTPEFPYQLLSVAVFTALLLFSYLLTRRRQIPRVSVDPK